MNKVLLIITLMISGVAGAEDTLVFEAEGTLHRAVQADFASFAYKKKRGTATIAVTGDSPFPCSPSDFTCVNFSDTKKHKVDGLYFDRSVGKRGAVMFDTGEEQIVCAYRRRLLWPKETGLCNIELIKKGRSSYTVRLYVDL